MIVYSASIELDADQVLGGNAVGMLDISEDIRSLTDFKRNTSEFVEQLKETGRPVVLTVNGKAELVVQDAESYQKLLEALDRTEAIEGIRRGIESMERGEGTPAKEALERIRKKFKLPKKRPNKR